MMKTQLNIPHKMCDWRSLSSNWLFLKNEDITYWLKDVYLLR